MNSRKHLSGPPRIVAEGQGGFALIITISLMVLLSLLAVGLLSLSSISLRLSSQGSAQATARSNARLALAIAIGELQKYAGPDRRVTASADLTGENQDHPHWLGVWDTRNKHSKAAWLVSGNEGQSLGNLDALQSYPGGYHTPDTALGNEDSVLLHTGLNGPDSHDSVHVPKVVISNGAQSGHYAWSISDEGTKARIDVTAPDTKSSDDLARLIHSRVPQQPGLSQVDSMLDLLGRAEAVERQRLVSISTLDLAVSNQKAARTFFHHLTTGGAGLPVNVVAGGLKNDLSVVFDSSQQHTSHVQALLGATPKAGQINGATSFSFHVDNPERFYLSGDLSHDGQIPVGPNWGILYNYGQLWKEADDHQLPVVRLHPDPDTDLRNNDWAPYNNLNEGSFQRDIQHTNSGVYPVLGMLQMGFRLSAEKRVAGRQVGYQMQLQMKPLVGIWNPYNVRISNSSFNFVWALYPYLRLGIIPPGKGQYTHEIWMRENWMSGTTSDRAVENGLDKYFNLTTEAVDLEPGEFRIFSVDSRTKMGSNNRLVSTWNEEGAFTIDLRYSKKYGQAEAGDPILVPAGTVAWYGDLFIEDYQHPSTENHFGDAYSAEGVSASWFGMRSGGNLHRISDLWQTPTPQQRDKLPYPIPEQVISEWARTGITAAKLPVEQFAESPYHIGTWRWFSRTASEAAEGQSARGWIDTNPRYAASNPAWDGSRIAGSRSGSKYEGWNFISPLLGASYDDTYDGGPPGRGKIAEGQNEVTAFPEAVRKNGRYQGHTGFSTSSAGQTHVAIFDVPRSPLVSIGQFQHAHLARYGFEPGFVAGNSYANPRIPLDQTLVEDFADIKGFRMIDISHAVNKALWDDYFFSTIGKDYTGGGRGSLDKNLPFEELASGTRQLSNPRHQLRPQPGDDSFDSILTDAGEGAARAMTARVLVDGAFNVNSTSKQAWKAVLTSMADFEMPILSHDGASASWETPKGIRFPRFGHPMDSDGWESSDGPRDPSYWRGFRKINADELDALAEQIVEEVRQRGPFRSFADFVNRDPQSNRQISQHKGALQAALDRVLNNPDAAVTGGIATPPDGSLFSKAANGESQSAGQAGYLLQGDILQSLAPILQVRSDFFRIRTMGEATDAQGKVIARQFCEAFVQRVPEYLDPADRPEIMADDLDSEVNQLLGRRLQLVSFRWLAPHEI